MMRMTRVFRGLPLVVVEVRGHRDDGLRDRFAEVVLCDDLHFLKHHRADLGDAVVLVTELDAHVVVRPLDDAVARRRDRVLHLRRVPLSPDEALGRVDGVLGVGDRLALGDVADEPLARLGDGDHRGRRLVAAAVGDHGGHAVLDDGDARVRGPEVDSDYPLRSACHRPESPAWGLLSRAGTGPTTTWSSRYASVEPESYHPEEKAAQRPPARAWRSTSGRPPCTRLPA
jgi:NAD-specific glutamate dehydrogenase